MDGWEDGGREVGWMKSSLSLSGGFTPSRHLRPPGGNRPPGDNPLLFSISGTGSFICPVAQARLDIPRPLITQSRSTGGKTEMFSSCGTRTDNISGESRTRYQPSHPGDPWMDGWIDREDG